MKTYTLSVNTLMWKLTSERHDNCVPCLGPILPIRWVTPPPNSCLKCFSWRHICKVFTFDLSSSLIWLHIYLHNVHLVSYWYIHIFVFCPLQHSLIAMTSCFLDLRMWSDTNPFYASTSDSIYPNHMHSIETIDCLLWVLFSRRHRDKNWICFNAISLFPKNRWSGNDHPTIQACAGTWNKF